MSKRTDSKKSSCLCQDDLYCDGDKCVEFGKLDQICIHDMDCQTPKEPAKDNKACKCSIIGRCIGDNCIDFENYNMVCDSDFDCNPNAQEKPFENEK